MTAVNLKSLVEKTTLGMKTSGHGESDPCINLTWFTDAEVTALHQLLMTALKLVERLEWANAKLRELGKTNAFSLGMVRSLSDCEGVVAEARGVA